MKVVDLFIEGNHKTDEGKDKIISLKSKMNNQRTEFT
jgi:hypothetical protein